MKKVKFIICFLLSICFLGTNLTNVSAHDDNVASLYAPDAVYVLDENETIMPRAQVCYCGKGVYKIAATTYTPWKSVGDTKCIHEPYGTDLNFERTKTVSYRCDYCQRGYDTVTTEKKSECHGYH